MPQDKIPSDNFIRVMNALEKGGAESESARMKLRFKFASRELDSGASSRRVARGDDGVERTWSHIEVSSKALVTQVFDDIQMNYSVSGYNKRAAQSIGEIYLGLDPGEDY